MKRVALLGAVVAMFAACIDWETALTDCANQDGCREDVAVDGGVEVDAGGGAGGGTGIDAGATPCPGLLGRACGRGDAGVYCFEHPAHPVNMFDDVLIDETALWGVGNAGAISCFDGRNWYYEHRLTRADLLGISGDDGGVTIVGRDGQIRRWSYVTKAWSSEALPAPNANEGIVDVWRTPNYELFASLNQVCEKRAGLNYTCLAPGFGPSAVNAGSPTNIIAVGGGRLLRSSPDGGAPTLTTLDGGGPNLALTAACVFPDGGAFVGGNISNAEVFIAQLIDGGWVSDRRPGNYLRDAACRANGTSVMIDTGNLVSCDSPSNCPRVATSVDTTLTAVKEGAGGVVVAGAQGKIQRLTDMLMPIDALPNSELFPSFLGVSASPSGRFYAVGMRCLLYERNDLGIWSPLVVRDCFDSEIQDLYFQPNGVGWLVGYAGNIWRLDPGATEALLAVDPTDFNFDFHAVAGNGEEVWAVGENDLVARLGADGGWEKVQATNDAGVDFADVAMRSDGGIAAVSRIQQRVVEFGRSSKLSDRFVPGLASDGEIHAIWVDDANRIYVWTGAATVHTAVTASSAPFSSPLAISPSNSTFNAPVGLSVCGSGSAVLVSDNSGRVLRATLGAGSVTYTELGSPSSVAMYGMGCGPTTAAAVGEYGAVIVGPR